MFTIEIVDNIYTKNYRDNLQQQYKQSVVVTAALRYQKQKSLTLYISDDDRYLVSSLLFRSNWLCLGREDTGNGSTGETPSSG